MVRASSLLDSYAYPSHWYDRWSWSNSAPALLHPYRWIATVEPGRRQRAEAYPPKRVPTLETLWSLACESSREGKTRRCSNRSSRCTYSDVFVFTQIDDCFECFGHFIRKILAKFGNKLQTQLLLLRALLDRFDQFPVGIQRFRRVIRAILVVQNVV